MDLDRFADTRPGPRVGRGALDIDAGFGALSVTSASTDQLLTKVELDSGARTITPLPDGTPVAVETGERAVRVGIRGARPRAVPPSKVVRINPGSGRIVAEVGIPRGIQDIAVGGGAAWITNRATPTVTRLDVRTGALRTAPAGRGPAGVAVGAGAVRAANAEASTVSRVDRDDLRDVAQIAVPGAPRGVAHGSGLV